MTRILLLFCLPALLLSPVVTEAQRSHSHKPAATKAPAQRKALTASQVFDKCKDSIVTIRTESGQGTGFFISSDLLQTCFHVIANNSNVTFHANKFAPAPVTHVFQLNRSADVAFLYYPSAIKPLDLGKSDTLKIGDPLYVIGSPRGLEQTLTEGILSGRRVENGLEYLQISAAISPGSSGSPVFNKYGEVVGMVTSTLKDGQSLNFALSQKTVFSNLTGGVPLAMLNHEQGGTAPGAGDKNFIMAKDTSFLRDLGPISLVVEELQKNTEDAGLHHADIQSQITAQLRGGGITVYEDVNEATKYPGSPYLYINLNTIKSNIVDAYSYNIIVSLNEQVALLRKGGNTILFAVTWTQSMIGICPGSAFLEVRKEIKEMVDRFIQQYQEANPKK